MLGRWWWILAAVSVAAAQWKSAAPIIYNIDYQDGHVGSAAYLKTIADAPPDLLHVGEDVVFSSVFGTKDGYAGVEAAKAKVLSPEEVEAKFREVSDYVDSLHRAGVRWVIPYLNNQLIFAEPATRGGFLAFFDRWEQFQRFGFGPRPETDILAARRFIPFEKLRYPKQDQPYYPNRDLALCSNHPVWLRFLRAVAANTARSGYDGAFVDVMTLRDYCESCERKFRAWVERRFPPAERVRRYGAALGAEPRLGHPGEGALWADSQAFWSAGNAELLRALREEGARTKPGFFVIPNLGPFAHADGVIKRATQGMDPGAWAPESAMILFEEMQRPGRLRGDFFIDNVLAYKLAFAVGTRAGMLLYLAQEAAGIELAMAEAGAGGGGALIQGYYRAPEARRKHRAFFEKERDLFEGYTPLSPVAVLFDYAQLYWGNRTHLQALYRLSEHLARRHVPFDLVTPAQVATGRLKPYRAVLTPAAAYLADGCVRALQAFAAGGGLWVDVGASGRFDDAGIPRREPVLRGRTAAWPSLDHLLAYPSFALYLLTEEQANELKEIDALTQAALRGEFGAPAQRPVADLVRVLEEALQRKLSPLPESKDEALRVHLWRREEPGGETLTAHLVNYDCPIPLQASFRKSGFDLGGPAADYAPRPRNNLRVRVPVPRGRVTRVQLASPDADGRQDLPFEPAAGAVEFTVPALRIYQIAAVSVRY